MDDSLTEHIKKKLEQKRITIHANKKGDTITETTNKQAIIDAIVDQAALGDKKSQEMILAYIDGKPNQRIDITSNNKEISAINISTFSTEELHRMLKDGKE